MGNASKKLAEKCDLLTKEEQKSVAATFKAASRNSAKIREEDLIKLWGPQIDPRLAQYLSNFLFGSGASKQPACEFNRFAELYVYNVRGTPDERMSFILQCLGKSDDCGEIPYQLLKEYCESIASTYIKIVKADCPQRASPWLDKGFQGRPAHVQALGEAVAAAISESDEPRRTTDQMLKWLNSETLLKQLAETVFTHLYGTSKLLLRAGEASLLPLPEGLEAMPDYPAFTDLSHIVWLNSHIPQEHQHKWRFLFSSHIHGESFATLTGRIIDQGPSILIIEDTAGHMFGGFAPAPWSMSPNWAGADSSFLFTLAPRMRVYHASGFNDHYQYLNQHTKTLPNGLIMGGQLDFAAIWLPADPFGEGSSAESCTTYRGYRRLSKEHKFHIKSLEVWGVGDKSVPERDGFDFRFNQDRGFDFRSGAFPVQRISLAVQRGNAASGYLWLGNVLDERDTSVLDANPEAKAILEMAGKTRHSEGLREPPPL